MLCSVYQRYIVHHVIFEIREKARVGGHKHRAIDIAFTAGADFQIFYLVVLVAHIQAFFSCHYQIGRRNFAFKGNAVARNRDLLAAARNACITAGYVAARRQLDIFIRFKLVVQSKGFICRYRYRIRRAQVALNGEAVLRVAGHADRAGVFLAKRIQNQLIDNVVGVVQRD